MSVKTITIEEEIKNINKKNILQKMWSYDTASWIINYNKDEILKYLPLFISKIKSFKVRTVEYEELLEDVNNGELQSLKDSFLED